MRSGKCGVSAANKLVRPPRRQWRVRPAVRPGAFAVPRCSQRIAVGATVEGVRVISVTGGVTFEELIAHFHEQARGLHAGGVDYFLIETAQDTRNIKAAIFGI